MDTKIITLWEDNKEKLKEYISKTNQSEYSSYQSLVKLIVEHILNSKEDNYDYPKYDADKITVIDDGDYQGTQIFIIPQDTYQPSVSEYLVTNTYYGSCSGCDTLQSINDWEDGIPSEEQINDYMALFLHLIQRMKPLYEE